MGYFRTLSANGGGGHFGPPAICQTTGPFLDPKAAFDISKLELSKYVAKFHLKVSDGVTGRVNDQFILLSVIAGFAG